MYSLFINYSSEMNEDNLSVYASTNDHCDDEATKTPMEEVNEALKICKFGKFHIKLLLTNILARLGGISVATSISFLMPNAECDLSMDLNQKGILTSMPFFGMMLSTMSCGFLVDTFGRKPFLLFGFGGIFLFGMISGTSQTFWMLAVSKFFEGLFFASSFTPTITLLCELIHNDIRDRIMLLQGSIVSLANVVIAALSWAILTQDWRVTLFDGYLVLNSWNFYLYILTLPSLAAALLFLGFPESPKYLVSQERYDEAREVLIKVYTVNTGNTAENCPFANLWKNKRKIKGYERMDSKFKTSLYSQLVVGTRKAKELFGRRLGFKLLRLCVMIFCTMILYNIIRFWYPQLATIVEHFNDNEAAGTDLCVILDTYTSKEQIKIQGPPEKCVPNISGSETYINSIILGLVCFVPYVISGVLVNRVGKKILTFTCCLMSAAATLGIRFSSSKLAIVSLFSLDAAITQLCIGLYQVTLVECFPTASRSLALGILMTVGRIGILLGSIGFPILLNMGCVYPFYTLVGMMICVSVLTLFLPSKFKK